MSCPFRNQASQTIAIVLGSGVIGLCSAIRLLEDGWKVHIIAEKWSPNLTSDGAAGFFAPFLSHPEEKVAEWTKGSWNDFQKMKSNASAGIFEIRGYEFSDEEIFSLPKWMEILPHREARNYEIPKGSHSGVYFQSLVIDPKIFMPWLSNRFKELGGTTETNKIQNIKELIHHPLQPSLIVNCTGIGSYELLGDKEVYPVRGQVVRVDAKHLVKEFFFSENKKGEILYILPKTDCIVLGGTAQKGDWNTNINPETSKDIIKKCSAIIPGLERCKIMSEWVGLRPGRTSIRLEKEEIEEGGRKIPVIHNYGHSGSGITLSWGCANDVQNIARSCKKISSKL